MANFKMHTFVASAISGIAAVTALAGGLASANEVPVHFMMGVIGGLLPDIDSDNSTPVKLFFNFLAFGCAFVALFSWADRYSITELLLLWGAVFFAVRYLVFELFTRLTHHRGVFHSLLAAVFFACLVSSVSYHFLENGARAAWLSGLFVFMGYVVHLLLDELYSVDLLNTKVKRSFGSALKVMNLRNIWASLFLALATAAILTTTPNFSTFLDSTFDTQIYQNISKKLFPDGEWFADLFQLLSWETALTDH